MSGNVSAVVKQQQVSLAVGDPHATPDHLDIKRWRHRWSDKRQHIDDRRVKARRQDITRRDAPQRTSLEETDQRVSFLSWGVARDRL